MSDKEFSYLYGIGYTGSLSDKRNAYYTDLIANGGDPNRPSTGQYVPERILWGSSASVTSGIVYLSFFTAYKTQSITAITGYTAATAAGATPTVCQYGLYSVDSSENCTLLSDTPNDTALFAAANTAYRKALTTPQSISGGSRYAIGVLVVTGAATPTFVATAIGSNTISSAINAVTPRLNGARSGQSSMPASIAVGNIVQTGQVRCFLLD